VNIFVLSINPVEAASFHCDQHLNKMILETAQLMSTAIFYLRREPHYNYIRSHIYKPTHQNHPCSLWLRPSSLPWPPVTPDSPPSIPLRELVSRWNYLYELAIALQEQRVKRFNALHHASLNVIKLCYEEFFEEFQLPDSWRSITRNIPSPEKFAVAAPHIFKLRHPIDTPDGTVACYQSYYRYKNKSWINKGSPQMAWTGVSIPSFMNLPLEP